MNMYKINSDANEAVLIMLQVRREIVEGKK